MRAFFEKLNPPLVLLGVGILVVVVNGFLFYHYKENLASAADTAAPRPTAKDGPIKDSIPVVVEVADAPAGLSIYEDGQLVVDQVGEPGFSQEFEPEEELTISTNNAGGVRTKIGEWELGALGDNGESVTRDFTTGGSSSSSS